MSPLILQGLFVFAYPVVHTRFCISSELVCHNSLTVFL